jgi:hypothetical protein
MTIFEHLLVVPSVIYGLAIARLLQGLGECVHPRERTRLDWIHLLFAAYLLLIIFQEWWRSYSELTRRYGQIREAIFFYDYFAIAFVPGLLYLAAAMLMPEDSSGEVFNLSTHYYRVRVWFFGVLSGFHLVTIADDALLLGNPIVSLSNALLGAGALASLVLAIIGRRWVHATIGPMMMVGQVVHIALFSLQIPL